MVPRTRDAVYETVAKDEGDWSRDERESCDSAVADSRFYKLKS